MIGGHDRHAAKFLPLAAQFGDASGQAEQPFHGGGAQGDDDHRLNHFNLRQQIGQARLHFLGGRLAVARALAGCVRTAFEDVRDIDRVAPETHRLNDFRQELPGSADKRFALLIFVGARRLAHKHQRRIYRANSEHDILARRGQVRAFPAHGRACLHLGHGRLLGFATGRRARSGNGNRRLE